MKRKDDDSAKLGFTLVDLIVVISVVLFLIVLALPVILRSRANARLRACKNNLRQIGVSMHKFADSDRKERYCSGANDYLADGCTDTWGWVADMVNQGAGNPANLLCPSSPLRGYESLNDLLASDTKDPRNNCPIARLSDGLCGQDNFGGLGGGSGLVFGGTAPNSQQRAALVARGFLARGYNTNYASSWHLVRCVPRYELVGDKLVTLNGVGFSLNGLGGTYGPLTRIVQDSGPIAADRLAILGCAASGESALSLNLTYGLSKTDPWASLNSKRERFISAGQPLSKSFNRGPATWNGTTTSIEPIGFGVDVSTQLRAERKDDTWDPPVAGNNLYLQDTRNWYAWHGSGREATCNILFCDGSVREFSDTNGDKFLNPGFPVPSGLTEKEYSKTGYRDDKKEISEEQMFNGIYLIKLMTTYFE